MSNLTHSSVKSTCSNVILIQCSAFVRRRQRGIAMGKTPAPLEERHEEREPSPQPPSTTELYSKPNAVFPGDVGEKKLRKKSALAQQWEQKFGGNA